MNDKKEMETTEKTAIEGSSIQKDKETEKEEKQNEIEKYARMAKDNIEQIKKATLYDFGENPDEVYACTYVIFPKKNGGVRIAHEFSELSTFAKSEQYCVMKIKMKNVYDYVSEPMIGTPTSIFEAALGSKKLDEEINQEIDNWTNLQMEKLKKEGKIDTGMKEIRKKIVDQVERIALGDYFEKIKMLSLCDDEEQAIDSHVYVVVFRDGKAKIGHIVGDESLFSLNIPEDSYLIQLQGKYTFKYSSRNGYDFDFALINWSLICDIRNEVDAWAKMQKEKIDKEVE